MENEGASLHRMLLLVPVHLLAGIICVHTSAPFLAWNVGAGLSAALASIAEPSLVTIQFSFGLCLVISSLLCTTTLAAGDSVHACWLKLQIPLGLVAIFCIVKALRINDVSMLQIMHNLREFEETRLFSQLQSSFSCCGMDGPGSSRWPEACCRAKYYLAACTTERSYSSGCVLAIQNAAGKLHNGLLIGGILELLAWMLVTPSTLLHLFT